MPTHRLDQRNLFNADAAGISDGLIIGPSAFINGDGTCAVMILLNDAGAEVVMQMRRNPETAGLNQNQSGWQNIGDVVTSSQTIVRRTLSGYQYRANILVAGDTSKYISFEVQEEEGSNRAYMDAGDRDVGRCYPGGFAKRVTEVTQLNVSEGNLQEILDAQACDPVSAMGVVDSWS